MAFFSDLFGNQSIGTILGNAIGGAIGGSHTTTNPQPTTTNNGGFGIPVSASVDSGSINKIFGWIAGIVAGTVLLIVLFRRPKR